MPEKGLEIARDTNSIAAGLEWTALAGNRLDRVVDYELHRRMSPKDLTAASLDRILALNNRAAIIKIAGLPPAARDALFSLDSNDLNVLLRSLSEDELTSLADYLDGLRPGPRETVLKTIAASPAKMQLLASQSVRDGIIASRDQAAAAAMMLEPGGLSPRAALQDAKLVWDGRVVPLLLWNKHPQAVVAAGLLSLVIIAWLARLFRRRQTPRAPATGA
jgi:hypothetical protein